MSEYRKVKSIYSISFVTISFIIWSTLSKWLFQNPVEYKLFLICSCVVLFTQYIATARHNKILVILPLGVSIIASVMFFNGQAIMLNTIYLLFATFTIYFLEGAPIDHSQYKEDINKSMVLLIFIWIISFRLGIDFVDEIYKFHILYIIMIIILMRETQRYVHDIKSKTSMVTNIIIGISVLTLSLDYAGKIVKGLLDILKDLVDFVLIIILTILSKIFGPAMGSISGLNLKNPDESILGEPTINNGPIIEGLPIDKPEIAQAELQLQPILILVFKIVIVLIILYVLYKFLTRFRSKAETYNGFIEEKERIVVKNKKKHWIKGLFGKIGSGGGSNREKILYTYKGFEKITKQADIYKTYMTATQLKNVTKVVVDNFDDLEEMTAAYNEAKFSVHDITEDKVQQVKNGSKNIKRQL
ncbi:hypothetical protein [Clostridium sp.]|uniref:hypothetical protein n=1 Tax=Clostridium sp. TaxID=1506 RepID=UPI001A472A3C|nr:hypothetical protein [Clostridium sp.]MBK5239602.1 hypothetical protein [Clostridium sp.]